jgi:hypothetical protein
MMVSIDPAFAIVSTFPLAFRYNVLKDFIWFLERNLNDKSGQESEQARYS